MIGVLGAGESGIGAAVLAQTMGLDPFVSDHSKIQGEYRETLVNHHIRFEEGGHDIDILAKAELIVKSPGIPDDVRIVRTLDDLGLEIISEIEFGYRYVKSPIIAITGSNGKTTTTNLVHHILTSCGMSVAKGGNLGQSFCRMLVEDKVPEYYILEVSSFQLDGIRHFRPKVGVILNITPDHLDRYNGDIVQYAASKWRMTINQKEDDLLFLNGDDLLIRGQQANQPSKARIRKILGSDLSSRRLGMKNPGLRGAHNACNASFAIDVARELGLPDRCIRHALDTFINDDHRMQIVARINGVEWINDSKATNVDAVYWALEAMKKPVVWIAGGVDKGNDYGAIEKLVESKVKVLICLGTDNKKLIDVFSGKINRLYEVKTMEEAIFQAHASAERGDVVILSPACASFDRFDNYKDRGSQFIDAVWKQLE